MRFLMKDRARLGGVSLALVLVGLQHTIDSPQYWPICLAADENGTSEEVSKTFPWRV